MSELQQRHVNSATEIPCMLLPMVNHSLILPTTTIAEMSPMLPLEDLPDLPDWVVGLYNWRNMKIPVISIESINSGGKPPINPQGRIAVLNSTGTLDGLPFIGIHTQGIPRMTRVSENDIQDNPNLPKREYDALSVKVGMEEFYLPDVAKLEMATIHLDVLAI